MRRPYGRDTLHTVARIERGRAKSDRAGPAEMVRVVNCTRYARTYIPGPMTQDEVDLRAQLAPARSVTTSVS
jgi:hypothetical protein